MFNHLLAQQQHINYRSQSEFSKRAFCKRLRDIKRTLSVYMFQWVFYFTIVFISRIWDSWILFKYFNTHADVSAHSYIKLRHTLPTPVHMYTDVCENIILYVIQVRHLQLTGKSVMATLLVMEWAQNLLDSPTWHYIYWKQPQVYKVELVLWWPLPVPGNMLHQLQQGLSGKDDHLCHKNSEIKLRTANTALSIMKCELILKLY